MYFLGNLCTQMQKSIKFIFQKTAFMSE
uniref:Uncharacterized protein n=1 Tax=Anguilla anguilla TaxID=7936 RepID=A0A0E9V5L5_ANGAN